MDHLVSYRGVLALSIANKIKVFVVHAEIYFNFYLTNYLLFLLYKLRSITDNT